MRPFSAKLIIIVLLVALSGLLAWAILSLPFHGTSLRAQVFANMGKSGVSNPVTAVLLNFRGYDTLLEIVVLFLAALGAWSLGIVQLPDPLHPARPFRLFCGSCCLPWCLRRATCYGLVPTHPVEHFRQGRYWEVLGYFSCLPKCALLRPLLGGPCERH